MYFLKYFYIKKWCTPQVDSSRQTKHWGSPVSERRLPLCQWLATDSKNDKNSTFEMQAQKVMYATGGFQCVEEYTVTSSGGQRHWGSQPIVPFHCMTPIQYTWGWHWTGLWATGNTLQRRPESYKAGIIWWNLLDPLGVPTLTPWDHLRWLCVTLWQNTVAQCGNVPHMLAL